jgi:hypothetical protein
MNPQAEALKARTKKFALDVLAFLDAVPAAGSNRRVIWQLSDSATSVGANYRAVCRARSDPEFAAKSARFWKKATSHFSGWRSVKRVPLGNDLPV